MIPKRWIVLLVFLSAAAARGQTSVTEVLTVNGTDPTHAEASAQASSTPTSDTPIQIATAYYTAMQKGDAEAVRPLLAGNIPSWIQIRADLGGMRLVSFSMTHQTIDGSAALVDGTGVVDVPGGTGRALLVAVLVREGSHWKIDMEQQTKMRGMATPEQWNAAFAAYARAHGGKGVTAAALASPPAPGVAPAPAPTPGATPAPTAEATSSTQPPATPSPPAATNPGPTPEPVFLMSIVKPLIFLIVLGGWAYLATKLDKDIKRNTRTREMWNGVQIGAAGLAFFLWLVIPFFVVGLFIAILAVGGAVVGYGAYRNTRVAESQKWRVSLDGLTGMFERRHQAAARDAASVILLTPEGRPRPLPDSDDPAYPAHQALEMISDFMLPRHAEEFDLLADGQQTSVSILIDGVNYPQPMIEAKTGLALIDYIKLGAGLDINERRRKQTGRFAVQDGNGLPHAYTITTQGSTKGLMLSGRAQRENNHAMPVDKLGLVEAQKNQLFPALDKPGGVVIVTSPPHQGQSTTLYSLTSRHDPYTLSVIALEEQFEFDLEGVTHEKLDPSMDAAAINQKLKGSMLREAGVVLMTKMADAQTAALMLEYAGQARFYVGMRVEDTFAAVRGWVKAVGNEKNAAASLRAVTSQRLIRKLCTTCRVAYKPDPEVLRKLNLPAGKVSQFYKHSGQVLVNDQPEPCPACLGLGYRGRTGVFEVIVIDDEARSLLAAGQYEPLRAHLRKQKMLWLQEAALVKVIEGETSIGEITRALGKEK